ncbi:hypothetical protein BU25DRAFT_424490 [Macroventuria anomochaeta]|uniref:Uncharacterized protein n=1 Tax=Macroventuria anomochaeta TaxID=301207 RepID=A0ACB6RRN2_9PLEO|nr:uncharacterized protein BU25DRAFT_424490 [Macroventuria anomochaeta]KAF2623798.1 hypothetical protein BU25DRAFT_424490 [Macroventuria anomochaeta]
MSPKMKKRPLLFKGSKISFDISTTFKVSRNLALPSFVSCGPLSHRAEASEYCVVVSKEPGGLRAPEICLGACFGLSTVSSDLSSMPDLVLVAYANVLCPNQKKQKWQTVALPRTSWDFLQVRRRQTSTSCIYCVLISGLEMRNHIYTFATYATTKEGCCVVPCLALAQTCRQIRHEYRSMCLRADVVINWRDVPSYFDTFFPTSKGKIVNIGLVPKCMTIFTNTFLRNDQDQIPVELDLLPILKFGLANKMFTCKFVKCEVQNSACVQDEEIFREEIQTLLAADVNTIQKLLTHQHQDWVEDVTKGRIHRLMVSHIGTDAYPHAKFYIGPGEDNSVPSEFVKTSRNKLQAEADNALRSQEVLSRHGLFAVPYNFNEYVRRVELRNIFLDNPYVFLWDFEWDETDQDSDSSFVQDWR